jgi:hypothetical protein
VSTIDEPWPSLSTTNFECFKAFFIEINRMAENLMFKPRSTSHESEMRSIVLSPSSLNLSLVVTSAVVTPPNKLVILKLPKSLEGIDALWGVSLSVAASDPVASSAAAFLNAIHKQLSPTLAGQMKDVHHEMLRYCFNQLQATVGDNGMFTSNQAPGTSDIIFLSIMLDDVL